MQLVALEVIIMQEKASAPFPPKRRFQSFRQGSPHSYFEEPILEQIHLYIEHIQESSNFNFLSTMGMPTMDAQEAIFQVP